MQNRTRASGIDHRFECTVIPIIKMPTILGNTYFSVIVSRYFYRDVSRVSSSHLANAGTMGRSFGHSLTFPAQPVQDVSVATLE